jgi:glucan 1,3-beta-glucosidase
VTIGGVGSEVIIDAVVTDTPIFLQTTAASNGTLEGSIVLNNIELYNVPVAVGVTGNATPVLAGGTTRIGSWAQGNIFQGSNPAPTYTQGPIAPIAKASSLLDRDGRIFGKTRPTYANYAVDEFVSVKTLGAKGDGMTDDTAALQAVFDQASQHVLLIVRCRSSHLEHSMPAARLSTLTRASISSPRR